VSHQDLPHLFDKFYRGNQKQIGGIGLGLSIVKGFVEALGGNIQVYAALPHGVGFHVSVPVQLFTANGNTIG
jgi:two-component system sensor histidine kinase KdpD